MKCKPTAKSELSKTKEELLKHPDLWRAGHLSQAKLKAGLSSGFAELDQHLPAGGWPTDGLVELLMSTSGVGELRLLLPAMRTLTAQQNKWLAWINPPFIPYAPALQAAGVDVNKIMLVRPKSHQDTLWALERASQSGTCSAVLAWPDAQQIQIKLKDTQRLQVAAKAGGTLTCLFRPQTARNQASMAELRMLLSPIVSRGTRLSVDILKRRGGWPLSNILLTLGALDSDTDQTSDDICEQLELWRSLRPQGHAEQSEQTPKEPDLPSIEQSIASRVGNDHPPAVQIH